MDAPERDNAVVRQVRDGNRAAFAELVQRYQHLVASVAWRYGARAEDIEDVVSEVFVKVFARLDQYQPEARFSTWLYRVAVNHVLDRARRSRPALDLADVAEPADPAPSAAAGLEADERAALVRRALDELPPRYREVMFLVYVEGLPVAEAARLTATSENTAKTRLLRGRRALAEILARLAPGYFEG
ncbi:MAG: sigma-70 family RNA polymerase sigma factor [Acidobacteria bacterium]|nr:sigma-70 family RNA polymerase sigma factor [Acidobacteriota bacterium]